MNYLKFIFRTLPTMLIIISCDSAQEIEDFQNETTDLDINNLNIPNGFDFSTHKTIEVNITGDNNLTRYDVFAYSNEALFVGMETYQNESGVMVTDSVF